MLVVSIVPVGIDIEFSELQEILEKQFDEVKVEEIVFGEGCKVIKESTDGDTVVFVNVPGDKGVCSVYVYDIDDSRMPRDNLRQRASAVRPDEVSATIIELLGRPPRPKCIKLS